MGQQRGRDYGSCTGGWEQERQKATGQQRSRDCGSCRSLGLSAAPWPFIAPAPGLALDLASSLSAELVSASALALRVSANALALLLFCSSSLSLPASAPLLLSHSRSLLPVSEYAAHGRSPVGPLQLHGYPSSSSLSSQLPSSQLASLQRPSLSLVQQPDSSL